MAAVPMYEDWSPEKSRLEWIRRVEAAPEAKFVWALIGVEDRRSPFAFAWDIAIEAGVVVAFWASVRNELIREDGMPDRTTVPSHMTGGELKVGQTFPMLIYGSPSQPRDGVSVFDRFPQKLIDLYFPGNPNLPWNMAMRGWRGDSHRGYKEFAEFLRRAHEAATI